MEKRKEFVLVDDQNRPVEAAGAAPFDGVTIEEAEAEARATVDFQPGWHMVPVSKFLTHALKAMGRRQVG